MISRFVARKLTRIRRYYNERLFRHTDAWLAAHIKKKDNDKNEEKKSEKSKERASNESKKD